MVLNVQNCGIVSDGSSDVTCAVQQLLDKLRPCGGTVYFPAGIYHCGSLELYSHTTVYLENGACLKATGIRDAFPVVNEQLIPGYVRGTRRALLFSHDAENICLCGGGTVDGNGEVWWNSGEGDTVRPRSVMFINCKSVTIENLHFVNSPCWTVNPICCENVSIDRLSIRNPYNAPNTDGINPESCKDVRITNCCIDVGDDCLAIKAGLESDVLQKQHPCENITVSNCLFAHGHGGIVIGSETSGGVKNVIVSHCVFRDTDRGIRIKTRRKRGGIVEDLIVSHVIMDHVIAGITINGYYMCGADVNDKELFSEEPAATDEGTPVLRHFLFSDIIMKRVLGCGIYCYGLPEMPISQVQICNADIRLCYDGGSYKSVMAPYVARSTGEGIYLKNVKDFDIRHVHIESSSAAYVITNAENTIVDGVPAEKKRGC